MLTDGDQAGAREAADQYCLRPGEAAALLARHPWRRFVVLGDSVAAGVGEPTDGYLPLSWVDRLAAELAYQRPGLAYLNLGATGTRAAAVRSGQLRPALDFRPDLALVACGGSDALDPRYRPEPVDRELGAMVISLLRAGAEVVTMSLLVSPGYPFVPEPLRAPLADRLRLLGRRTRVLGAALGTIHIDLSEHPASADPDLHASDGLHGNGRSHAIVAAAAVRRLGAHLAAHDHRQ